jgi:Na+/melibiose symporter-like transporter
MVFFAMFGSMFLTTQYLQTVLGYSALEAGVRMLPMALVMFIAAPIAPRIVERVGTKLVVGVGMLIAAGGMVIVSQVPETNGYPHLLVGLMIVSLGMGIAMAPATESIMGSLPPAKAGVGSAMNDTTRQVGSALGVAVIGSALATSYRPGVAARLQALHAPADVVRVAKDSVGGAVEAASRLPGPLGDAVTAAARHEFVSGLGVALLIAAAIVAFAAVVVFAFLPARAADTATETVETDAAVEGFASITFAEAEGALEADTAGAA